MNLHAAHLHDYLMRYFQSLNGCPIPHLQQIKLIKKLYGTETEDTDCPFKALHLEREKDTLYSSFFTASKVQGVGS